MNDSRNAYGCALTVSCCRPFNRHIVVSSSAIRHAEWFGSARSSPRRQVDKSCARCGSDRGDGSSKTHFRKTDLLNPEHTFEEFAVATRFGFAIYCACSRDESRLGIGRISARDLIMRFDYRPKLIDNTGLNCVRSVMKWKPICLHIKIIQWSGICGAALPIFSQKV